LLSAPGETARRPDPSSFLGEATGSVTMARQVRGVSRIVGTFVNPVVNSVDVDAVLEQVDLDEVISRVDIERLIDRVDIGSLIDRVDLDRLLERLDVNELLKSIDINGLVTRLDIDSVAQRIDLNRLLDQIDLPRIIERAQVGKVVTDSAGAMALSALDLIRRQLAGIDAIICYAGRRLVRRSGFPDGDPRTLVASRPAGPLTRLLAYVIDTFVVSAILSLGVLLCAYLAGLFLGHTVNPTRSDSRWWVAAWIAVAATYYWACVTLSGRTVGKALLGLRVVHTDGGRVSGWRSLVRVAVFPFSLVLGLGLIGIVTGPQRQALYDHAAKTTVVYDWNGRMAQLPSNVAEWLAAHAGRVASPAPHP
jgi:uncharacterized RDD family membrane protein YckC